MKVAIPAKLRPRGFKREMNSDMSPFAESETPVIVVTFEVKIRGAGKVKGTADRRGNAVQSELRSLS